MSFARSLLGSLAGRASRPSSVVRLATSSAGPSSSSARPALRLPQPLLLARRSYAVEVPPSSRTPPPPDDVESLREAFPEPTPPEVRSAVEEVEQSEGLRRLATNEAAQDVFKRFSAYLESKGHDSDSPPTIEQFGKLLLEEPFRNLLMEMKKTIAELGLSEAEVGNLGKKMVEIQRNSKTRR